MNHPTNSGTTADGWRSQILSVGVSAAAGQPSGSGSASGGPASLPSRAALEAGQLEQLRCLLAGIFPGNPFYRRKLESAGLTFAVSSLADFARRFPFTTKAELAANQLEHPPFGTNLTYPLACYTRFHQTSGTAGPPLRWLDTPESWEGLLASWREVYRAADVQAADRVFFAFSFGPFLGFWTAFESAARLGCLCLPGGGLGTSVRLRALLDNGATVLCGTPTYVLRLGETAAALRVDLRQSRVRRIIVAGEPGGSIPATRARLETLWPGARVFDHHGMTEVGPVTYECPARPGVLHVIEGAYLAEILAPATGQPVAAGATGELVLTTLGRLASPLLRYRTGDLVRRSALDTAAGQPCACGRQEMTLAGGILGRVDDMVIVRGVNIYPAAVEQILRGFPEVAEYRVRLSQAQVLSELTVEVEAMPGCASPKALALSVEQALESAFALRVPVGVVAEGSLPRFELKAQRWVRA
jgi:phenylacetate-CoA ligase